jgi:hypothetical protein
MHAKNYPVIDPSLLALPVLHGTKKPPRFNPQGTTGKKMPLSHPRCAHSETTGRNNILKSLAHYLLGLLTNTLFP